MKFKIIFLSVLTLVISSTIFVQAQSNTSNTLNYEPFTNNDTNYEGLQMRYEDATLDETHINIISKKIELANLYLSDYVNLSPQERTDAFNNYVTDLRTYIDENYPEYSKECQNDDMFEQRNQNDDIIIQKLVLMNQFLSNWDQLTLEEKQTALNNYHEALRNFMIENFDGCNGGRRGHNQSSGYRMQGGHNGRR